jgi:hypothetical protein
MRNRKLGYVIAGVVATVAVAGALVGGYEVGLHRRTSPVAPLQRDRVVGIEVRCEFELGGLKQVNSSHNEMWGKLCVSGAPIVYSASDDGSVGPVSDPIIFNRRQVLTVRMAEGIASYTVAVPMTTHVALGDSWPP